MICLHCPCCPHLFTVNDLIIKEKVAVWSGVSWHPLPKEQDKCTNTRTHTDTHTISVSSNLSYEIFITALCAQLQCHASVCCLGLVSCTISLTLGVKYSFLVDVPPLLPSPFHCLLLWHSFCLFFTPSSSSLLSELPAAFFFFLTFLSPAAKIKVEIFAHKSPIAQFSHENSAYYVVGNRTNNQIRSIITLFFQEVVVVQVQFHIVEDSRVLVESRTFSVNQQVLKMKMW